MPQHSADPAGLFTTFPGWRVAAPTTPADYVGCWNAAVLCRDPVLIIDDHRLAKTSGILGLAPEAGLPAWRPRPAWRLAPAWR